MTPTSGTGSLQFGGGRALVLGEAFRCVASGVYSTTGTPNLAIRLKLGKVGETGATTLFGVNLFPAPADADNLSWKVDFSGEVVATGASGQVRVSGTIQYQLVSGTWTTLALAPSNVVVNTSNTSHNRKLDVSIQWGAANVANTARCDCFDVWPLTAGA